MQVTMELFIVVAALTLIVQAGILVLLFFQLRKTTESVNRIMGDLHSRMGPILTRTQIMLDDTQPKIAALVEDASQIVYLTRTQAQKFDKIATEATDRLRGQLVHLDRILTGTLEAVEDAGSQFRRSSGDRCTRRPRWCTVSRLGSMCCARDALLQRRMTPRWNRKTHCLSRNHLALLISLVNCPDIRICHPEPRGLCGVRDLFFAFNAPHRKDLNRAMLSRPIPFTRFTPALKRRPPKERGRLAHIDLFP